MLYQKQEYIFKYEQNNTKISLTNTSEPAHTIGTKVPLKKKEKNARHKNSQLPVLVSYYCATFLQHNAMHRHRRASCIQIISHLPFRFQFQPCVLACLSKMCFLFLVCGFFFVVGWWDVEGDFSSMLNVY